ncbi:molybdopterin molybdotransferase [Cryobacterium mesophilum]|uniref:Molybdopterin molybdenumtransferase n=1 Tax=Terrimesophilobacter mesophilus TaxID=433647 RepID=A0A4R8VAG6_9MICO|nr:gephyrin-like molybdotransferase Glp [Terrimesophilobacter mesophilus]MBB5633483.1 molybdopterin molybdotransferase [Terrimesophilobacter mesophilus]TFB80194.1 molybdopterin molybdotransferase MoeA [Terrimesophilobacter mesophilus]
MTQRDGHGEHGHGPGGESHDGHGHDGHGHGQHGPATISVAEHRARILAAVSSLPARTVPLALAQGRVLAADVVARVDVPGFENSAMDGYALRQADAAAATPDAPVTLQVVADLPAGSAEDPPLAVGDAARIMTGAPVPHDADCIVPVEDTDGGTVTVLIRRAPEPAAHIRHAGSDVRAGETVLPAGRMLGARDLAAASAVGVRELLVHPAPRVGVLSTGTELRPAGEPLARGQIHDSNSILLAAAVAECGGIPVQLGSVPDDEDALRATLEKHAGSVDAFVTSGGVSVGAYDVVKAVLAPLGVWFGPVRMQPGKPQGFGDWPGRDRNAGTPIFALPGNPVSVFISFEEFVRPALLAMQGRTDVQREVVRGVASEQWRSPAGRAQYMPVVAERHSDGTFAVRPASGGGSGSYLVASLAGANAVAAVPEDVTMVQAGDLVDVTLVP